MYSKIEEKIIIEKKIIFELTKEEKEILEKAADILSNMQDMANNNIDSDYFDETSDTLYDIVQDIKPTDESETTYVYVFKEEW